MIPQITNTIDTEQTTIPSKTYKLNFDQRPKFKTYKVLNYIDTSGAQWINTGFIPNRPFKIVLYSKLLSTNLYKNNALYGVSQENGQLLVTAKYDPRIQTKIYLTTTMGDDSANITYTPFISTFSYNSYDEEVYYADLTIGGTTQLSAADYERPELDKELYLFANNNNGIAKSFGVWRLFYAKIYLLNGEDDIDETLINDFVPILDDKNVPCLYDNISKKLFYSLGEEPLIAGTETGTIIQEADGNSDTISGFIDNQEAMKQAIYHTLAIERYSYIIYTNNYGAELEQYIGKSFEYLRSNIETTLRDALTYDLRILDVEVNSVEKTSIDVATVKFTAFTIYGNLQLEVNVNV